MFRPQSFRHLTLALVCSAAALTAQPALADDKSAVKAALVYNIMRFVKFPGDPGQLKVCATAADPVAGDLRRLDGRNVGRARISVVTVNSPAAIGSSCDVVYLDSDSPRSIGGVSHGQILIGGGRNFAEAGGTVGLINFGGQVRFVINSSAARRADITFSAQLMQLAAKVIS
ncbi:MAG: YfiR family protein [Proteobacteria bacterium]|nr:YfiR family protein [Pseudomonadota bacterium]